MKSKSVKTEREKLELRWRDSIDKDWKDATDLENFKVLVFDTYNYLSQGSEYNSVLRGDLPIFRLMCIFSRVEFAPRGFRDSHFRCCQMFAEGLCCAVENGFKRGYYKKSLPLLSHIAPDEADMSTFESFSKHFTTCLKCYEEAYAESEEEYWDDCEDDD